MNRLKLSCWIQQTQETNCGALSLYIPTFFQLCQRMGSTVHTTPLGKWGASGNPNGMWVKMNFYPPAQLLSDALNPIVYSVQSMSSLARFSLFFKRRSARLAYATSSIAIILDNFVKQSGRILQFYLGLSRNCHSKKCAFEADVFQPFSKPLNFKTK